MFPSHSYSDQALPFESNTTATLSSKQEIANYDPIPSPPPLSFFLFPYSPSPFEDNQIFLEQPHDFLFPQFQHQQPDVASEPEPPQQPEPAVDNMIKEVTSTNKSVVIPSARRRPPIGKRERHSKINTAKGLRDRRMRLSLEVAKRFFGLQDMLGFDKASKTVEWLLNQAKVEINKLIAAAKKSSVAAVSSTSELSSLEDQGVVVVKNDLAETDERNVPKGVKKKKRRTIKQFHPLATRECREKARERARKRTKEKMMRSKQCCTKETTTTTNVVHNKLSQIQLGGSWNPLFGEESGTVQSQLITLNNHPSLDLLTTNKAKELSCSLPKEQYLGTSTATTTVESLAAILGKSSSTSSMVFSSLNNYNSGLHQEASLN